MSNGNGPSNIANLVTTKPDAEVAKELKEKIIQAHEPLLKAMDEANSAGFQVQTAIGPNAFGKMQIQQLMLVKQF